MEKRYKEIVLQKMDGAEIKCEPQANGDITIKVVSKGGKIVHEGVLFVEETSSTEDGNLLIRAVPTKDNGEQASDVFMQITAKERKEVEEWIWAKEHETEAKGVFLDFVLEALEEVQYDYWISTIEPSVKNGKLTLSEGEKVAVEFSPEEWDEICKAYAPERGSRMAELYELFIWYAWRAAKGYWKLNYLVKDSSKGGNYRDTCKEYKKSDLRYYAHGIEKAGARTCGGFKDGQGNTCKLVKHGGKYKAVGGCYRDFGKSVVVAHVANYYGAFKNQTCCSAVIVMTKPPI